VRPSSGPWEKPLIPRGAPGSWNGHRASRCPRADIRRPVSPDCPPPLDASADAGKVRGRATEVMKILLTRRWGCDQSVRLGTCARPLPLESRSPSRQPASGRAAREGTCGRDRRGSVIQGNRPAAGSILRPELLRSPLWMRLLARHRRGRGHVQRGPRAGAERDPCRLVLLHAAVVAAGPREVVERVALDLPKDRQTTFRTVALRGPFVGVSSGIGDHVGPPM
jgi:hypothetical protein